VRGGPPGVLRQLGVQRTARSQALPSKEARRRLTAIRQPPSERLANNRRSFSAAWAPHSSIVFEGWGALNEHSRARALGVVE
jgi:hypothetical protein